MQLVDKVKHISQCLELAVLLEASRSIAREILNAGFEASSGKNLLSEFDKELGKSCNLMNPGTTADIIATALALILLSGYRS